jgi:molecular chaperone DnaK (HSP70)
MIPKIQEMIRESFKKSEIIKTINVDEAVAIGA